MQKSIIPLPTMDCEQKPRTRPTPAQKQYKRQLVKIPMCYRFFLFWFSTGSSLDTLGLNNFWSPFVVFNTGCPWSSVSKPVIVARLFLNFPVLISSPTDSFGGENSSASVMTSCIFIMLFMICVSGSTKTPPQSAYVLYFPSLAIEMRTNSV
jgi:hypothetical protein